MKTNFSESLVRIVTALLGAPIIIGFLIFGGNNALWVLTFIIVFFASLEASKMFFKSSFKLVKTLLLLVLISSNFILWFIGKLEFEFFLVGFTIINLVFLTLVFLDDKKETYKTNHEHIYFVFIYFYLLCGAFFLLKLGSFYQGTNWILSFLLFNWGLDSGAYFIGKKFGKRKLIYLSPKKTIEGSIGGILIGGLVLIFFKMCFFSKLNYATLLMISIFIGISSQFGDLLESHLKRLSNVKNSGHILPGHGGFLDRFDGILMSAPVMYFIVFLVDK